LSSKGEVSNLNKRKQEIQTKCVIRRGQSHRKISLQAKTTFLGVEQVVKPVRKRREGDW